MADDVKDTSTVVEPTLIFGKYKTMAEAEKALKEAETKMHSATGEAAQAKRDLSLALEQGNQRAKAPDKTATADDESVLAQALLTTPSKVIGDAVRVGYDAAVAQSNLNTMNYVETRLTIKDFVDGHPLTKKHKELFKTTLTDAKGETLEARLEAAHTSLESILTEARSEGKKNSEAERKAKAKASMVSGTEDEGAVSQGDERDEEEVDDTQESYLKSREAAHARLTSGGV